VQVLGGGASFVAGAALWGAGVGVAGVGVAGVGVARGGVAGVASAGHGGGHVTAGGAGGVPCPASAAGSTGVAGLTASVGGGVTFGAQVGGGGVSLGVGSTAGVGSPDGVEAGVWVVSVGRAAGGGGVLGGPATDGGSTVGGSTAGGVTEGAGDGGSMVAIDWGTLPASAGCGFAGGENREPPAPVVYQASNPGATTPMAGICSGPAISWKSRAAVEPGSSGADDVPTAVAAGSTVVCEMARSDAIVSAVAPAPSTEEAARGERWCCALRLPMGAPVHSGTSEPPS
jgi:hypothetical protein